MKIMGSTLVMERESKPTAKKPVFSGAADTPQLEEHSPRYYAHQNLTRRMVAETALSELAEILKTGRVLTAADEGWLGDLQKAFGTGDVSLQHPERPDEKITLDGRLTINNVERLNQNPTRNLQALFDTLMAMRFATLYMPSRRYFTYPLEIHNRQVADMLRYQYKPQEFETLLNTCLEKGTFDLTTDAKTGLVKTAGIDSSEDRIMVQGWVTDSIRNGDRQRESDPAGWHRVLGSIARFYQNEKPAFDRVIADPAVYKTDVRGAGVAHLFDPETFIRYDWLNPKRLESHGLALKAFCEQMKTKPSAEIPDAMIDAVSSLAKYLAVIDYPSAPSNGPWEETPFNGFTWDTEAVRAAFESLRDLMHNPVYKHKPDALLLRERLAQSQHGDLLSDKKELTDLIRKGQRKVADRVKKPMEHPSRPADVSLAFVTTSTIRFSKEPLKDIQRHMQILQYLESHVVKENGVIRYEPFKFTLANGRRVATKDGYLMPNWGLAATSEGKISLFKQAFADQEKYDISHIEPSSNERFYARSTYGRENKEAHWFMIAEMAKGYGKQLEKMLNYMYTLDREPTGSEKDLLKRLVEKQTEYINRSFARITGDGMLKANGKPCQSWKVPEAYQHVSTFNGLGETRMLPGVNTPLAWASSSMYSAATLFRKNLRRIEAL